jgi:hypothetical protein
MRQGRVFMIYKAALNRGFRLAVINYSVLEGEKYL